MITFKTATRGLALAALFAGLAACGTPGAVATNGSAGSGTFMVARYEGLSSVQGSRPARWTQTEIDQVLELDQVCRNQLDPQFPNKVEAIARGAAENSLWSFLGIGGGSGALPGADPADYGPYGAAAGAASGAFAGSMSYDNARKYAQSYCVSLQVGWAQNEGALRGVGIVPWVSYGRPRIPQAVGDPSTEGAVAGQTNRPPPR